MSLRTFIFLIAILPLLFCAAQAKASQTLRQYIEEQLQEVGGAMAAVDAPASTSDSDEAWYFRRTLVRARARVGFDVEFGKIQILPEVEIVWQRDLPDGWQLYKPRAQ